MKKLFTLLFAAFLLSCSSDGVDPIPDPDPDPDPKPNPGPGKEELEVTVRATLPDTDNISFNWLENDRIGLFFDKDNQNIPFQRTDSGENKSEASFKGTFTVEDAPENVEYIAYYPYNEKFVTSSDGIRFPMEKQVYNPAFGEDKIQLSGFPAIAYYKGTAEDVFLDFTTMYSIVKVPVTITRKHKGVTVNSISLEGNGGEAVYGDMVLSYDPAKGVSLDFEGNQKSVILEFEQGGLPIEEGTTDFYMAVAPGEYKSGFTVTIDTSEGEFTVSNEAVVLESMAIHQADGKTFYCVVPDPVFRGMLAEKGDVVVIDDETGEVEIMSQIDEYESVNLSTNMTIKDLTGIEYFSNLKQLQIENAVIEKLDLSHNALLEQVWCRTSKALHTLKFGEHPNMEKIYCSSTAIVELDVTGCPKLNTLVCENATLEELDLSNCPLLETLQCTGCKLTSLDISENKQLVTFECSNNPLSEINIKECANLKAFKMFSTQVKSIDLSGCTGLTSIDLDGNSIESINLANLKSLQTITFGTNKVSEIDLSDCAALTEFKAMNNNIKRLDFSNNPNLKIIWANGNPLEYLDISGCNSLNTFWLFGYSNVKSGTTLNITSGNPVSETLHTLIADNLTVYQTLSVVNTASTTGLSALRELSVQNCSGLKTINAVNCASLQNIYVYGTTPETVLTDGSDAAVVVTDAKKW